MSPRRLLITNVMLLVFLAAPAAAEARVLAVSAAPQWPQNLLPAGFSAPHAAQRIGSCAPQSPQNFIPAKIALPQLGQSMPSTSKGAPAPAPVP